MKRGRYITLFIPEKLDSCECLWRRYVISAALVDLEERSGTSSGNVYVFRGRSAAYHAAVRCVMPRISSGCAVLPFADISDDTSLTHLPEGCLRVLDVRSFESPLTGYIRLKLG